MQQVQIPLVLAELMDDNEKEERIILISWMTKQNQCNTQWTYQDKRKPEQMPIELTYNNERNQKKYT